MVGGQETEDGGQSAYLQGAKILKAIEVRDREQEERCLMQYASPKYLD
jgi:hypothetical protein